MSILLRPAGWFYHEFGLDAIYDAGRNAYLIILARSLRMVAHGANSLILALFLSSVGFSDHRIGLFMTLTLLGDVFLGGFLTLIADRSGRRKVLLGGSLLMVMTGTVFALVDNFWVLLIAAVLGVVSATGGDFGPFRSIEESILSHLTTPKTRADVLAWYVTTSTLGSAIGSEVSGRVIRALRMRGYSFAAAYHALFWSYAVMGLINAGITLLLTDECEMGKAGGAYSKISQEDTNDTRELPEDPSGPAAFQDAHTRKAWYQRFATSVMGRLSQISASTRKVMYTLWVLLAVDSLADGMVPYSLTNYYIEGRFSPSKATLGDVNGVAYLLGAVSTVFAGPLARKIGLVNTMVFTHIPSSAAVLIFPISPNLVITIILLFVRAGLNNMDQAPRSAFIAGVVKPEERTAVMGITAIVRTLAAMTGPTVTGILAGNHKFWIAFVVAGACRLVYDIGLYVLFINTKLYQHEGGDTSQPTADLRRSSDEEEMTELDDFDDKRTRPVTKDTPGSPTHINEIVGLIPDLQPQSRRRSPSPFAKYSSGLS